MKIEKDIPMPYPRGRYGDIARACRRMEIGDSIFSPRRSGLTEQARNNPERTFATRAVDGGFRMWRTA